jgi:hypothetical protein
MRIIDPTETHLNYTLFHPVGVCFVERAKRLAVGDPFDEKTIGPTMSQGHLQGGGAILSAQACAADGYTAIGRQP